MNDFEVCKLVIVRVHTDAEKDVWEAAVDDFVVVECWMEGRGEGVCW